MTGVLAAAVRHQVEDLPGRLAFEATDDFAGFVKPVHDDEWYPGSRSEQ